MRRYLNRVEARYRWDRFVCRLRGHDFRSGYDSCDRCGDGSL